MRNLCVLSSKGTLKGRLPKIRYFFQGIVRPLILCPETVIHFLVICLPKYGMYVYMYIYIYIYIYINIENMYLPHLMDLTDTLLYVQ
jgi:hypothetical protein